MRHLFFLVILVIGLCLAYVLYLRHDTRQFERHLPQAPPVSSESSAVEMPMDTDTGRVELESLSSTPSANDSPLADTVEKSTSEIDEDTNDRDELLLESTDLHDATANENLTEVSPAPIAPTMPPGISLADWLASLHPEELAALYVEKPWLKPVTEMTPQELEAEVHRRRQQRIADFGNIPEVAILNKYTTTETLLGGKITMSGDEGVEYMRAISVLWPTEVNIQSYLDMEISRSNGWHD